MYECWFCGSFSFLFALFRPVLRPNSGTAKLSKTLSKFEHNDYYMVIEGRTLKTNVNISLRQML